MLKVRIPRCILQKIQALLGSVFCVLVLRAIERFCQHSSVDKKLKTFSFMYACVPVIIASTEMLLSPVPGVCQSFKILNELNQDHLLPQ